jgi:hypothetical protein
MSADISRFPIVNDNPPIRIPMGEAQFEKYMEQYKEIEKKKTLTDYDKLAKSGTLNKFWQGPRKYSNALYKREMSMQLSEFSNKMPVLLEAVAKYPLQKHYIYSAFWENKGSSQGVLAIAKELEALGYEKLTLAQAKQYGQNMSMMPQKKRYILAINSELGEGVTAPLNMEFFMKVYNNSLNVNGELVHCFVASQNFNEGLDMKAVRHIHIFEPLVTMAADLQTIGRARRYCSHEDLDQDNWTVDIHRYFSELPIEHQTQSEIVKKVNEMKAVDETTFQTKKDLTDHKKKIKSMEKMLQTEARAIDEFIYMQAREKMKELFTIYKSMEEASADCSALDQYHQKFRNKTSGYEDFKCIDDKKI